jgi:hypothetical protein
MVMTQRIGANLTNDEKRAHLIDVKREHLIDQVCPHESCRLRKVARMRVQKARSLSICVDWPFVSSASILSSSSLISHFGGLSIIGENFSRPDVVMAKANCNGLRGLRATHQHSSAIRAGSEQRL